MNRSTRLHCPATEYLQLFPQLYFLSSPFHHSYSQPHCEHDGLHAGSTIVQFLYFEVIRTGRNSKTGCSEALLPLLLRSETDACTNSLVSESQDDRKETLDHTSWSWMSKGTGSPSRFTARCFVPEILVDFIRKKLQQGREHLEPGSFFLQGVCLLVDISGFTKLSGEFCDRGKNGIDDLQLATNVYMGQLVEIIYKFGGDIIKFAGDAIICVFSPNLITSLSFGNIRGSFCGFESSTKDNDADQNPLILLEVILRAMHCAQMLRGIQTDKLSVHVAISCGELCFGILGGVENRWECLISGSCIHELSACLDDASSKEAAISAKCAELIKQYSPSSPEPAQPESEYQTIGTLSGQYEFILQALPSGNQKIIDVKCQENFAAMAQSMGKSQKTDINPYEDENPAFSTLIHQFVPIPIADELEKGEGLNYIAEIREVTTMFMKVS